MKFGCAHDGGRDHLNPKSIRKQSCEQEAIDMVCACEAENAFSVLEEAGEIIDFGL